MSEREYKEVLEEVRRLRNEVSRLLIRLVHLEHFLRRYGFPPFLPLNEEEFENRLTEEWIERHAEKIRETGEILSRFLGRYDIPPQKALLYLCSYTNVMVSFLYSKSLLGSCECGGQLQLLVEDNTVYLTCAKCGRWLWQGLKHV